MSTHIHRQQIITRMRHRDPEEEHRVSTPLELFFDLVFVVAIAFAAQGLHHNLAVDHLQDALIAYGTAFFAIWWAWSNFTWFASGFDAGDIPYKLLVFVQMIGALILASGVRLPESGEPDFTIPVIGYVIMRLALGLQWLRAGVQDQEYQGFAFRNAAGILCLQCLWIIWLIYFDSPLRGFVLLAILELLLPVWATRTKAHPWHPEHIVERYGLFTIIVLGESVLASSIAIQAVGSLLDFKWEMLQIIIGAVLVLFSIFWIYFGFRDSALQRSGHHIFYWAYGHYLIWAAIAAVGVGISLDVDFLNHNSALEKVGTGLTLAIPVATFLVCMWVFHDLPRPLPLSEQLVMPVATILVITAAWSTYATLLIGIILAILSAIRTWIEYTSDDHIEEHLATSVGHHHD